MRSATPLAILGVLLASCGAPPRPAAPGTAPASSHTSAAPTPAREPPRGYTVHRHAGWAVHVRNDARETSRSDHALFMAIPNDILVVISDLVPEDGTRLLAEAAFERMLDSQARSGVHVSRTARRQMDGRPIVYATAHSDGESHHAHGVARFVVVGEHGMGVFCESGESAFAAARPRCDRVLDSLRVQGSTSQRPRAADERWVHTDDWSLMTPNDWTTIESSDRFDAAVLTSPSGVEPHFRLRVVEFNGETGLEDSVSRAMGSLQRQGVMINGRHTTRVAGIPTIDFEYSEHHESPAIDVVEILFYDEERHRAVVVGCGGPESQAAALEQICGTAFGSVHLLPVQ